MPSSARGGVTGLEVAIGRGGVVATCVRPRWPPLIIADAANDPRRRNKFMRSLIMTVISVVPGSVKRATVSPCQGGSDGHARSGG
jgi:hypothetical protein